MTRFRIVHALVPGLLVLAALAGPAAAVDLHARSEALLKVGRAALEKGDVKTAREELQEAIVAHPGNAEAHTLLGVVYERDGNDRLARRAWDTALAIEPEELGALQLQGVSRLKSGDLETAERNLERLTRLCGDCAQKRTLQAEVSKFKQAGGAEGASRGG